MKYQNKIYNENYKQNNNTYTSTFNRLFVNNDTYMIYYYRFDIHNDTQF